MISKALNLRSSLIKSKFLFVLLSLLFLVSCTSKVHKAMQSGSMVPSQVTSEVETSQYARLIIVPVKIKGKMYRFLLDTGAPNSISEELQEEFNFRSVDNDGIRDSQGNSREMKYVAIDTIQIGEFLFLNTLSFVGDFKKNPVLNCMDIDGIVGSNLMIHAVWQIDPENQQIRLASNVEGLSQKPKGEAITLNLNKQFAPRVDLRLQGMRLTDMLIDYGFNGSMNVPEKAFGELQEGGALKGQLTDLGTKQSGLHGVSEASDDRLARVDSGFMGNTWLGPFDIETGHSGLIGMKILDNFLVTFDYPNARVYLDRQEKNGIDDLSTYGFSVGSTQEKPVYIRSIISGGPADKANLKNGYQLLEVNGVGLEEEGSLCDYAKVLFSDVMNLRLTYLDEAGNRKEVELLRIDLFE